MQIVLFDEFLRVNRKELSPRDEKLLLERGKMCNVYGYAEHDYLEFRGEKYLLYDFLHELLNYFSEITII